MNEARAIADEEESDLPEWRWLQSTFELQSRTYGYPLGEFCMAVNAQDLFPTVTRELAKYIDWNVTAAVQEIAEVREEFSWKPWATDKPFVNRERVLGECVDALHFLGNILTGIGVTDRELWEAYQKKQDINKQRQASGKYSAKKGGLGEGSDNI